MPVGGGGTYGFAGAGGERFDDPPAGRLERFRRRFAGFGGPVPAYLAALEHDEQLHFGPIEWVEPGAGTRCSATATVRSLPPRSGNLRLPRRASRFKLRTTASRHRGT
ncbi:MAG TPA: hypothetical protein VEH31_25795 [Streptosporangiaceae bacterium]|nr:hypothetical protein [Streptosporangiaceae bacterium]